MKPGAVASDSNIDAIRSTQKRTIGGSRLSEQNALTVIPSSKPSASTEVTTVTPDANRPITARNASWSIILPRPGPEGEGEADSAGSALRARARNLRPHPREGPPCRGVAKAHWPPD